MIVHVYYRNEAGGRDPMGILSFNDNVSPAEARHLVNNDYYPPAEYPEVCLVVYSTGGEQC